MKINTTLPTWKVKIEWLENLNYSALSVVLKLDAVHVIWFKALCACARGIYSLEQQWESKYLILKD
jgi:hypothetical protein